MQVILQNLSIGIIGSLIATVLAAVIIVIFRAGFSADRYISRHKDRLDEIERFSKDINLLYVATLRDLVIMNVLFFADAALWNIGEVLIYSSVLQRFVLLINELGLFSIRLTTVALLIIGLWIAVNSINRINRVLAYRKHTEASSGG